jgi:hypothetical protein
MSEELDKELPSSPVEQAIEQIGILSKAVSDLTRQNEILSRKTGIDTSVVEGDTIDAFGHIAVSIDGKKNVIGWRYIVGSGTIIDTQSYAITDNQMYEVFYDDGTVDRLPYESFRNLICKKHRPVKIKDLLIQSSEQGSYGMYFPDGSYPYHFSLFGEKPKEVKSYKELRNSMVRVSFVGENTDVKMSKRDWETGKMVRIILGRKEGESEIYDGEEKWIHNYAINP